MKNEIIGLEKKYWDAMSSHDYAVVKDLTKFPCIIAGKNGVRNVDEAEFKTMFDQVMNTKITVHSIWDEKLRMGADHALIGYLIELDYDGNAMKCACTSTWIKEGENWLCAMHTESDVINGK